MTENILGQALELPCGLVLKNRIVKSPMSDSLGDGAGNPTATQMRLYERWAEGGVALSLIGEVQCDYNYPEKPGNLVLTSRANMESLKALALRGAKNATHIWPQLGAAGALAHLPISKPKGPSALDIEGLKCEALSIDEIRNLPKKYAEAAKIAKDAGFGGVQIHAGHGFLFSQFLSPLFNHRTDDYGGSIENRFRIISEVIIAIRKAVGEKFPIGIRINSSDRLVGGLSNDDALQAIRMLDKTSVDLIDISGGTYFPGAESSSDDASSSGAYYVEFAKRAKSATQIPIMLTGGFKTQEQAVKNITEGSADIVGIARAMVLEPALANSWLGNEARNPQFPKLDSIVAGGVTAWYSMRLTAIGEDNENAFDMTAKEALAAYDKRDEERCLLWKKHFSL